MIVVQTSTSVAPRTNLTIASSSSRLLHLAVADDDPGVRHNCWISSGHLLDVLHAVVHEEDLALAVQLAEDRLADQLRRCSVVTW